MAERAKPTPQAIEAWVLESAPQAIVYANSLLRDNQAAEDIVHDCYYRLLKKANEYDLLSDGTKLLFRSVTNACINYGKRRDRVYGQAAGNADTQPELPDSKAMHPIDRMIGRELEQAIEEGLTRLPLNQRAALELKSLGHSLHDIAETLSITTSNAAVLIHRARQALALHLAPYLEDRR